MLQRPPVDGRAVTGGLGNPVIATAELGGAVLISFVALAAPAAAIALVVLFLLVAIRHDA